VAKIIIKLIEDEELNGFWDKVEELRLEIGKILILLS
jgi:hypothetical protein